MGEEGGDRPLFVFSAEDVLACRAVGREESNYSEVRAVPGWLAAIITVLC